MGAAYLTRTEGAIVLVLILVLALIALGVVAGCVMGRPVERWLLADHRHLFVYVTASTAAQVSCLLWEVAALVLYRNGDMSATVMYWSAPIMTLMRISAFFLLWTRVSQSFHTKVGYLDKNSIILRAPAFPGQPRLWQTSHRCWTAVLVGASVVWVSGSIYVVASGVLLTQRTGRALSFSGLGIAVGGAALEVFRLVRELRAVRDWDLCKWIGYVYKFNWIFAFVFSVHAIASGTVLSLTTDTADAHAPDAERLYSPLAVYPYIVWVLFFLLCGSASTLSAICQSRTKRSDAPDIVNRPKERRMSFRERAPPDSHSIEIGTALP